MNLRDTPRRSSIGLTPMIDVVFLLLVFFMLAARFTLEGAINVPLGVNSSPVSNVPRLLDVTPEELRLNGVLTTLEGLPVALTDLTRDRSLAIVLRPRQGAEVQRIVDVLEALAASGFDNLVLLE